MFFEEFTKNNSFKIYLQWLLLSVLHSETILKNTVEVEPQPVALDFKNLSQYFSRSK